MDEVYLEINTLKKIAIIGGGSASFVAAEQLSKHFEVSIYEKGKSIGKKFLVAGKGGFNLAHNFEGAELVSYYSPKEFMANPILDFDVTHLRNWYLKLGINTFVGSSNRVFPEKGTSPAKVLNTIKSKLLEQDVKIYLSHEFIGFSDSHTPLIRNGNTEKELNADYYIFTLGGGSWKVTGANSDWLSHFNEIGISTTPFEPSNCGLNINWPSQIVNHHTGKPLKNISITNQGYTVKGEALISSYGLEGNAVYPISSSVREELKKDQNPIVYVDLKPNNTSEQLLSKLGSSSSKNYAKTLNLDKVKMAILKSYCSKEEYLDPNLFIGRVKKLPIPIMSLRPVEEAISTVGGISIDALNHNFSLKNHPNIFCVGEMVNWDAPTGGFLLQGCFSMSHFVAQEIIKTKKPDKK